MSMAAEMRRTFGEDLKKAMTELGAYVHDIANIAKVPEETVRSWLDDEAYPTQSQLGSLTVFCGKLRAWKPVLLARRAAESGVSAAKAERAEMNDDEPGVVRVQKRVYGAGLIVGAADYAVPPPPEASVEGIPFREALKLLRESDNLRQDDVADLVTMVTKKPLTGQSVSQWEKGYAIPVLEHVEALAEIWPEIRKASMPSSQLAEKPDGGRGVPRSGCASQRRHEAPPTETAPKAEEREAPSQDFVPISAHITDVARAKAILESSGDGPYHCDTDLLDTEEAKKEETMEAQAVETKDVRLDAIGMFNVLQAIRKLDVEEKTREVVEALRRVCDSGFSRAEFDTARATMECLTASKAFTESLSYVCRSIDEAYALLEVAEKAGLPGALLLRLLDSSSR